MVRPTLEYAAPVWTPYMACDSNRLEAVQRRATRAVKNLKKKSYSERLRLIGLPTLSYRRKRADMIQVYNIFNSTDNISVNTLLTPDPDSRTRGHTFKLKKQRANTKKRANSFRHRVVDCWNSLPQEVVSSNSLNSFKTNLNNFWTCQDRFSL